MDFRPKLQLPLEQALGCDWSQLVYLGHGFQTQGTVATVVDLKVRPESTCVPGPWISDPRYGARVLRVLGPMV
jgi:hypothetical protein